MSKEPRKIVSEGKEGTSESFVRIAPSFGFRVSCFFFQKFFPSLMPLNQTLRECFLFCFRQGKRKSAKFFSGFQIWFPGKILSNNLHLMKLANLNGSIGKFLFQKISHSSSAINNKGGESKFCKNKFIKYFLIIFDLFSIDFFPKKIFPLGSYDQYSGASSEEGSVKNSAHGTGWRSKLSGAGKIGIKVFPDGLPASTINF